MQAIRNILVAGATLVTLATPALAQDYSMELSDRQAIMITTSGKIMRMTVSDKGHRMMMKYGRPMKAGTIFYMSGGTLYMAPNRPLPGSREMLVDEL